MTAADNEGFVLDVSEDLFRLSTECLRLYSNETCTHQTFAMLVVTRLTDSTSLEKHDAGTIREHFATLPIHGNARILLQITPAHLQVLDEVRLMLGRRLNSSLSMNHALSALLLDYFVEAKVIKALDRLERENLINGRGEGTDD